MSDSVEFYPRAGLYYPKAGRSYLRRWLSTGIVEHVAFHRSQGFDTEAGAWAIVDQYREQQDKVNVVTIRRPGDAVTPAPVTTQHGGCCTLLAAVASAAWWFA